jgi:hypothetical protein
VGTSAHALDQVGKIEMLEAEGGNVESDAGVEALVAPADPLAEDGSEAPLRQLVDEAVPLGERDKQRRLDGSKIRVIPADERFDPHEMAVAE